jgi:hypothetical protein
MPRVRLRGAAAAIAGLGHKRTGVHCQDAALYRHIRQGPAAIVVLADGAGSASHSDLGARHAVSTAAAYILENFEQIWTEPDAGAISKVMRNVLDTEANKAGVPTATLACTLLFVAARAERDGTRWIAGNLGDGLVVSDVGSTLEVLIGPERGEFANTTIFLTSPNVESHLRLQIGWAPINSGFLLMTDGAAESLYRRRDGMLAPACATLLSWADQVNASKLKRALMINLRDNLRAATEDDVSLALLRVLPPILRSRRSPSQR